MILHLPLQLSLKHVPNLKYVSANMLLEFESMI